MENVGHEFSIVKQMVDRSFFSNSTILELLSILEIGLTTYLTGSCWSMIVPGFRLIYVPLRGLEAQSTNKHPVGSALVHSAALSRVYAYKVRITNDYERQTDLRGLVIAFEDVLGVNKNTTKATTYHLGR